jgi:hypothetical protein
LAVFHLVVSSLLIALLSGLLGSLLGLGGGIFLVPLLILLLRIPIRMASGVSVLAVVATSTASTASYMREGLTNLRLGIFLELSTTLGALSGAFLTAVAGESLLRIILGFLLLDAALSMLRRIGEWRPRTNDELASRLGLDGSYFNKAEDVEVVYGVDNTLVVLFLSYLAGIISGLLGIGGGGIKVPALNLLGGVPMKAAIATSSFMIGVTAAAAAIIHIRGGYHDPVIAASVVLGTLIGASLGSRITPRVRGRTLRAVFVVVLIILGLRMILSGASVWGA